MIDFCKKIFQLTHVKDIMMMLGLSEGFLLQLVGVVKTSMIVVPAVAIGYGTVTRTYKDIHDQDVCILLDREAFNRKTEKLFGEKNFWEKAFDIVKTGAKNLVLEIISEIPLILKCILGYAIATGFEQACRDPEFLTDAQKNSFDKADKIINDLGDSKLTHEQAMQIVNKNFQEDGKSASALNMLNRSNIMDNTVTYDPKTKTWDNLSAKHYNITNHGAMNADGTQTKFDNASGTYKTEKLSETVYFQKLHEEYGGPPL